MANNLFSNSSNSNHAHELSLSFDRHTDNFYAGATHPLCGSIPTIMRNGRVGQLQLHQMASELRRSSETRGCIQGRVRIQSSEGDHQVLGSGSSSTTPNPYEIRASSSNGNVSTNAQILGASSSSSSLIIDTVTAKELMGSQILYTDPSIWKRLRTNLSFKDKGYNHGIRAPSPGLGLNLNDKSWNQQTQVTSNYNPDIPNQIISFHSSYPNHPSSQTYLTNTITHPHNLNNIGIEIDSKDDDDGHIRSLPHKKNGPYTCSDCNQEFPTSQHFASHVRAKHYKDENKAQRSKRLMSKLRPRNFCIGKLNGQITCLPVSSSKARDTIGNSFAPRFDRGNWPFSVKVEVDKEVGLQDQTSYRNGS